MLRLFIIFIFRWLNDFIYLSKILDSSWKCYIFHVLKPSANFLADKTISNIDIIISFRKGLRGSASDDGENEEKLNALNKVGYFILLAPSKPIFAANRSLKSISLALRITRLYLICSSAT